MREVYYYEDGSYRDPDCPLAKMTHDIKFQSGKLLPEGTIIEIELRQDMSMTTGRWREEGSVFAVVPEDYEIVEGPITPRLFYD